MHYAGDCGKFAGPDMPIRTCSKPGIIGSPVSSRDKYLGVEFTDAAVGAYPIFATFRAFSVLLRHNVFIINTISGEEDVVP